MVTADPIIPGAAALAEAKAYLRISGTEEDPVIERLLVSGGELCEQFTGQALLVRSFAETIQASTAWTRLRRLPVVEISSVETSLDSSEPLAMDHYAIDVDASGAGWVRLTAPSPSRSVRVRYKAGLAEGWQGIPEPMRQGLVRLVGHFFSNRSGEEASSPPAAVTALWRPYRRMRLS